jgi:hypothetical protein
VPEGRGRVRAFLALEHGPAANGGTAPEGPPRCRRPALHLSQILAWADAFHARLGRWPRDDDGKVVGQVGLTWNAVDQALQMRHRGLRPGSSLAKLLREHRGKRHKGLLSDFTLAQVLGWADAHYAPTGAGRPAAPAAPSPRPRARPGGP